jgi:hypothetical protein
VSNEVAGSLPLTLELQTRSSGAVPDQSYLNTPKKKKKKKKKKHYGKEKKKTRIISLSPMQ